MFLQFYNYLLLQMDDNGMFLPEATIKNGKKYAENEEEEKKMEEIAKACAPGKRNGATYLKLDRC